MTKNSAQKPTLTENRTIVLPFDQEKYWDSIETPKKFRQELDTFINIFPELFPNAIKNGYLLKESRISKKSEIPTMDRHLFSIGHDQGQNGIGNGAG